jgi:hypothetical protein
MQSSNEFELKEKKLAVIVLRSSVSASSTETPEESHQQEKNKKVCIGWSLRYLQP